MPKAIPIQSVRLCCPQATGDGSLAIPKMSLNFGPTARDCCTGQKLIST